MTEKVNETNWKLSSPKKMVEAEIFIDVERGLILRTYRNNTENMECVIALQTNQGTIGKQPLFLTKEQNSYEETYQMPAGREPFYHHASNELSLLFAESELEYRLVVRAFDEGVAYRLTLLKSAAMTVEIISEPAVFLPKAEYIKSWLQTWVDTYEGPYEYYPVNEVPEGSYGMPCLFQAEAESKWLMVTEAGLLNTGGEYCSCHLKATGNGAFDLSLAPEQEENIKWTLPGNTPWRVIMMADGLEELLQNRMVYHLNPPAVVKDLDFIKPGRCLWSWWSFENGAQLYTEQKKYVDMAAAYGFEAVTVDAGWDDTWVARLCDYAKERDVQIWLWSDMQSLDSYEKAKPKIERWAKWGVAGLKVDFFMNDSTTRMEQYHIIANLMTENKLMINFHGNTKPAGEGRTWPHLMTEEGIMGLEHYKWSGMPNAQHNCTVPFTRNVIGPMDYTPTGFSNKNRNTTLGHQLALSIVFDTGIYHVAESIHSLLAFAGTEFLRRTHGVYDETRLLDGYPGSHVVMLKRKDLEWYIGGISAEKRAVTLDLAFLPEGEHEAILYADVEGADSLEVKSVTLNRERAFTVDIPQNGGFAIYITREIKPLSVSYDLGYMTPPILECKASEAAKDGGVSFAIEGLTKKLYTLRIWYKAEDSGTMKIQNRKEEHQVIAFEQSGGISVTRTVETKVTLSEKEKLIIWHDSDSEAIIEKIQVIDNDPSAEQSYLAQSAKLLGTAKILPVPEGEGESVQGIGGGGSLTFDEIEVAEAGDYVLAMDYYAGENRPVDICVNDDFKITSVLFNSGGWETGHYNIVGRKEVIIPLQAGRNQISFSGEAKAPHFKEIIIFKE